jgi:hypothetical protein
MNSRKQVVAKPAKATAVATAREQRSESMRSTVLLSLIVCPNGGVAHHRHGMGATRRAS